MEAGPRDNDETTVDGAGDAAYAGGSGAPAEAPRLPGRRGRTGGPRSAHEDLDDGPGREAASGLDGDADGESDSGHGVEETPEEPQELRPQRKLRLWQLAPIVGLGTLGSLMFAFPLAFEPGGGSGTVVSMLGLLLCSCAAGWGIMAARRVGAKWPGVPSRASGSRVDWRVAALYSLAVCALIALAVLRVDRLP